MPRQYNRGGAGETVVKAIRALKSGRITLVQLEEALGRKSVLQKTGRRHIAMLEAMHVPVFSVEIDGSRKRAYWIPKEGI